LQSLLLLKRRIEEFVIKQKTFNHNNKKKLQLARIKYELLNKRPMQVVALHQSQS
ncbi:hypothetical protein X975_26062, partial [Stegodyphus mimosarum]